MGAISRAAAVQDKRSVVDVIDEMEPRQKEVLYNQAMRVMTSFDQSDVASALVMMAGNDIFRAKMINCLKLFVEHSLDMRLLA